MLKRYNNFPTSLEKTILDSINHLQHSFPAPHYAAFDADGTLWDFDVGENFFQFLIDESPIQEIKTKDPWKYYLDLKKKNPPEAYLWLAQICAGYSEEQIQSWALAALQKNPVTIFESQMRLIEELARRNIQIFIVSASVFWSVEAAIKKLKLPLTKALGVKTKVIGGVVSKIQSGPITWRQGKKEALLLETKGIMPLFCAGNTAGDIELLQSSAGKALAVQTQTTSSGHEALYKDEQKLLIYAQEQGWLSHSFIE